MNNDSNSEIKTWMWIEMRRSEEEEVKDAGISKHVYVTITLGSYAWISYDRKGRYDHTDHFNRSKQSK